MKKIPALFQRNYSGDRLVRNEVAPGCEPPQPLVSM